MRCGEGSTAGKVRERALHIGLVCLIGCELQLCVPEHKNLGGTNGGCAYAERGQWYRNLVHISLQPSPNYKHRNFQITRRVMTVHT